MEASRWPHAAQWHSELALMQHSIGAVAHKSRRAPSYHRFFTFQKAAVKTLQIITEFHHSVPCSLTLITLTPLIENARKYRDMMHGTELPGDSTTAEKTLHSRPAHSCA